jgi:uncharacterized phage protein gp47/JayE
VIYQMATDAYIYVTPTGTIQPDATTIQADVISDFQGAFGQDLITTPDTPQGVLIVDETLNRKSLADNNVALANQMNPNLAGGIYLDAIGALTGAVRKAATPTILTNVSLGGISGTVLEALTTQAQVVLNGVAQPLSVFQLITTVTLDSSGNGVGDFQALNNGNLLPAPGTLTGIVSNILGWETVVNSGTVLTNVTLTGTPGTIIPAGSEAQSVVGGVAGQIYESVSTVTIPTGGSVTTNFISQNYLAPALTSGQLNTILTTIAGWATVSNTQPPSVTVVGTSNISPGTPAQSDNQFRNFRLSEIGIQGANLAQAVLAAIYSVPNVLSASMRENVTNAPLTLPAPNASITIAPHSLYLCVDGGTDLSVAEAITSAKGGGCGYTDNQGGIPTSVVVTNPYSGQAIAVMFDRPTIVGILVQITVKVGSSVQDPVTTVQNAILAYVNGLLPSEPGLTVGQSVSPFEIAGAVNQAAPGIYVQTVAISNGGAFQNTEIPITLAQKASVTLASIAVTVAP